MRIESVCDQLPGDLVNWNKHLLKDSRSMVLGDKILAAVLTGTRYNFKRLRKDLKKLGHVLKRQCDTGVLLCGWHQYGQDFIPKTNRHFVFAWEKKAILANPQYSPNVNFQSPEKVFHFSEPVSVSHFFSDIKLLLPTNILSVDLTTGEAAFFKAA